MARKPRGEDEFELNESFTLADIDIPTIESENEQDKQTCWLTLFQEGSGNLRDRRWYKRSAVEKAKTLSLQARKIFDGHVDGSRSMSQDWLASIKESQVDDVDGRAKLRGRVWVKSDFWEMVKHCPEDIGVSINAIGRGRSGEVEGQKGKWQIIEDLVHINSFDIVSKTGNAEMGASMLEQDAEPEEGDAQNTNKESEESIMEYKDITLTELTENRADLIEAIEKSKADEIAKEQGEVADTAAKDEEIAKLKEEKQALTLKVDEHELTEKKRTETEARDKLITEAALPEDAMTDTFKEVIESQTDMDKLKAILEDRKAIFAKGEGVKESGAEEKVEEQKKSARPWEAADPFHMKEEETKKTE